MVSSGDKKNKSVPIRYITSVLFYIIASLYPLLVFYLLIIRNIPVRQFSLFIIAFAFFAFIAVTSRKKNFGRNSLILLGVGIICLITNSMTVLKFYPVLMNLVFLFSFGITLFSPPNMIFRFANMQDKSIKGSLGEKMTEAYCRKVTYVWCFFFILNAAAASWTIYQGSDLLWSVYNGGISYFLTGLLFMGELIVRKQTQKKIPKSVPFSNIKKNSRPRSAVMCYDGTFGQSRFNTWGDFLDGTARLRCIIKKNESKGWLLYCEDYWYFLLAFTALLQCKKEIILSANINPGYLSEIRADSPVISDIEVSDINNYSIPALLNEKIKIDALNEKIPIINADETSILMYTSGSTGKPKAIKQRLTEFENDNIFVLSKWGQEFLKRKLCSTVSQHHIYGLLYSIFLPFTAGVPFRRKRIEFPEELEKFTDAEYMLITVPAFLKRVVEIEKRENLSLKSPWIFTSGGVLDKQTAEKTSDVFGFWPFEVYGSTETSGIAWRQSLNGPEWTPFDNAQINLNQDGCLVIRSPYIKDVQGFVTADIAETFEDGRFLLKGRIDSVVKIEEKRISLLEMENRILESGLVSEVCVIPLVNKRQYLCAALVFNEKGKEIFSNSEKNKINSYWREYLLKYFENVVIPKKWRYPEVIPQDAQGKRKKEEIALLFTEKK